MRLRASGRVSRYHFRNVAQRAVYRRARARERASVRCKFSWNSESFCENMRKFLQIAGSRSRVSRVIPRGSRFGKLMEDKSREVPPCIALFFEYRTRSRSKWKLRGSPRVSSFFEFFIFAEKLGRRIRLFWKDVRFWNGL